MKVNTRELEGIALDWAVAQCLIMSEDYRERGLLIHRIGYGQPMPRFSTDWAIGGPIIEREGISIRPCYANGIHNTGTDSWYADLHFQSGLPTLGKFSEYGKTALVAAMRCFVASKLGDTVDIPDELV